MSARGKLHEGSWESADTGIVHGDIILLVAILSLGLSTRLLIAPYTSHGYDINVHKTWLFSLLETGIFFYVPPEGMGLFGKSWAHNPNFCELPPIYPSALFLMGKVYAFLRPSLDDVYLLVLLMKLPQIIAECGIAVLIYYIVRNETNVRLAACAALLFFVNPFTFFLTAVWGAPESLVAIFVMSSLYAAYRSRHFLAASLLSVSLVVKPYPIVFLIPLLLFSYPDLKFLKTLVLPLILALSAAIVASPWLIAQGSVFVSAMWGGAVHNLGIRMWEGTIWAFPSFWQIIEGICNISGFPYAVVAPFQFYVYLVLTLILCYFVTRLRANLEKKNIWLIAYLIMFSFMMFMPSAHEKWVYICFPLIMISAFLERDKKIIFLLIYAALTFTLFVAIYGNCSYFFMSTDVLPMPRNFVYGGILAESWYYTLWSAAGAVAKQFSLLPHPLFSTLIFFLSLKQGITWTSSQKLEAHSKKASDNILRKSRIVDSLQMRLDGFQTPMQDKRLPLLATPVSETEDKLNDNIKAFQSRIKETKEVSFELGELTKMFGSSEISDHVYGLIVDELGDQLSASVEEIFRLRETLELARAKAKLEWAKEKIGLKNFETPERLRMLRMLGKNDYRHKLELYSPLYRCEEIISNIDVALSSLTMEDEASIIEQYLSLTKDMLSPETGPENLEIGKMLCQQRLDSISERWASIRRDRIEQVMNHELKASEIKKEIEEVEVRFTIGEVDQEEYKHKVAALQGNLKNIEKEISGIRSYIDEMDMRIFRCTEFLRKKCERTEKSE